MICAVRIFHCIFFHDRKSFCRDTRQTVGDRPKCQFGEPGINQKIFNRDTTCDVFVGKLPCRQFRHFPTKFVGMPTFPTKFVGMPTFPTNADKCRQICRHADNFRQMPTKLPTNPSPPVRCSSSKDRAAADRLTRWIIWWLSRVRG